MTNPGYIMGVSLQCPHYCLSSQCQGSPSLLLSSITMANIRLNYNEECEALINKHINTKLCHGYIYLYMVGMQDTVLAE